MPVEVDELVATGPADSPGDGQRVATLTTPLGKDVLFLTRLQASEGLSEPFEFRIDALSDQAGLDLDKLIGYPLWIEFRSYSDTSRYFHGICVEAEDLGPADRREAYRLVARPWVWLLSQRANCRIFDKTVATPCTAPEIIKKVFSDAGFSDFRTSFSQTYPELEYCVQYRESDLAFVCRLMEENGIYYFFEHSAEKHTLVLADATLAHHPVPGLDNIPFAGVADQRLRGIEHIAQWSSERRHRTGKVSLNDYDYLQPGTKMLSESEKPEGYGRASFEAYDYPGRFHDPGEGERLAKVRIEAAQAVDHRRYGIGEAPSLFPGATVALSGHPSDDGVYLIVRCAHSFATESYATGSTEGDVWSGRFEFQPKDRQFRAPQITPKPVIYGPQTAKVVGKQGEEIDVDKYGRILVHFYWDRDKTVSRRVRVAQLWSGKGWGGQFIPRINMEVVVEHLEGDPDQPLVVGTVYNADNTFPYDMPAKQNRAGIKSESTKNGKGHYNEIYFDDTTGSEEIHMQAEHDHTVLVKHAETTTIGPEFKPDKGDAARTTTIASGDDVLTIEKGDQTVTLKKGNQSTELKMGDQTTKLDMGNQSTMLSMGNQTTKLDLGAISTEAMQSIELKVGQSSIKIDQMGVTIKGMMISIQGQIQVEVKGLMTQINADAMLVVKGAITMIN